MFTEDPTPGSSITAKNEQAVMRAEWLKHRQRGLGASDVAAVFGVSPYKSLLALYHEKRGDIEMPEVEREALYWGRHLEGPIAKRYAEETKRRVQLEVPFNIRWHPTQEFMFATLDATAEVVGGTSIAAPAGGPGVTEIKNVGFFKKEEWRDEPPLPFLIQVNHQMAVTGREWGSFAFLVGGNQFMWADVPRNNAFIEVLIAKAREFWQRVLDARPPEVDGSDSTRELLKQLYPKDSGRIIALPKPLIEVDEELVKLKAEQKKLQGRRDELENQLKYGIQDATVATLDNGAVYTFKTVNRREFTTAAGSYRTLKRKGDE